MPTSKPATITMAQLASMVATIGPMKTTYRLGATSMPSRKDRRQTMSRVLGRSSPPTMPLMPSTRPLNRMNRAEARFQHDAAGQRHPGVKWFQSIVMSLYSLISQNGLNSSAITARMSKTASLRSHGWKLYII